ncbi:hypothetical protein ONZ45_g5663 [Pleurotus djamor]|nr:hypothetical protein ONZ45_g5663 [Pleurotus djamor]
MSIPLTKLFIEGKWVPASGDATFEVRNPHTHQVVGLSSAASSYDCKLAIESAANAFPAWEHTSPNHRRDILLRAADLIGEERFKNEIMQSQVDEVAAPASWGHGQCLFAPNFLKTTAGLANDLKGDYFVSGTVPGAQVVAQRRAMGVILAIAPWNAPVTLVLRGIAVPLLCGNTVVVKSSEVSPRSQAVVIDLLTEAGVPPGVLNFISISRGAAPLLTAELIAHPQIRKINFTGSDRIGRIIAMEVAKYLKPCVFELGGKAPVVVLDDANIKEAARAISWGAMVFSGQVCMSSERIIVQRKAAPELLIAVKQICMNLKAGDMNAPADGDDAPPKLPPLFTEDHAKNVVVMIEEAVSQGAELVLGDMRAEGGVVQPHLLVNVRPGMKIWERESFGPVTTFAIVDTIDEAVELANATEYSLSASLWTTSMDSALTVAPRIRAGFTNVNGPSFHSESYIGVIGLGGASGYGRFGIDDFTDKRLIITHPSGERKYPDLL